MTSGQPSPNARSRDTPPLGANSRSRDTQPPAPDSRSRDTQPPAPDSRSRDTQPLRVGHKIIVPGSRLEELPARLEGAGWDMVEIDVLSHGDRLVIAHDPSDLEQAVLIDFDDALAALGELLPMHVGLNIDIKTTGYEARVADAIGATGLADRILISTMELDSLLMLRRIAPQLRLGLSVPKARRNYLANPLTRPAAYAMLEYLRRTLPRKLEPTLADGTVDAVMAHWGVVTPRLSEVVRRHGRELYVWTVDDHRRLPLLTRLGVTGVITNDRLLFARAGLEPTR
jgi:glycerophosphoryl diester phosphodiesterase